jgi:hypothetical protein
MNMANIDALTKSSAQMKTWKLNDDVTNLLASHSTNTNLSACLKTSANNQVKPAKLTSFYVHTSTPAFSSRLSNNTSLTSVDTSSVIIPNSLNSGSIDKFDEQIRYLDRQLKELETSNFDANNTTNSNSKAKLTFDFKYNTDDGADQIINSASYNSLADIKEEEAYFKKMK